MRVYLYRWQLQTLGGLGVELETTAINALAARRTLQPLLEELGGSARAEESVGRESASGRNVRIVRVSRSWVSSPFLISS